MYGNEELVEYIKEHVIGFKNGFKFYPDIKCILNKGFENYEKRIRDMEVYDDDVWLLTYPKCGTTWSQEMCWMIMNNVNYKGAEANIFERTPFLEFSGMVDSDILKEALKGTPMEDTVTYTENLPRPRLIKSHLPFALLPSQLLEKKPKIIFVLREPKDAAVSSYHHNRMMAGGYTGTVDKFFETFLKGVVMNGSYWHFNAPLWEMRNEPNVLALTYEEMKKDLESVVRRTAKFLGKTVSEEDMSGLLDHLSFNKMKTNNAVNMKAFAERLKDFISKLPAQHGEAPPPSSGGDFIRKGEVGDHKNIMSTEMINKFNETHSKMKDDLEMKDFPY